MRFPKKNGSESFLDFASAAGLDVDAGSVASGCLRSRTFASPSRALERWAELVEITDQSLAKGHMTSLKTMTINGGFFSQRVPLIRSIESKSTKTYQTNGSRLDLVAYYDKQFPAVSVEPDLIPRLMGEVAPRMIASGVWTQVWFYDTWSKSVLWTHPTVEGPSLASSTC